MPQNPNNKSKRLPRNQRLRARTAAEFQKEMQNLEADFMDAYAKQERAFKQFMSAQTRGAQDFYEEQAEEQYRQLKESLKAMQQGYTAFGKYMDKSERKAFEVLYKNRVRDIEALNESWEGLFDFIEEEIDSVADSTRMSFSELLDTLRENLQALNVANIADSVKSTSDSLIDNTRQISKVLNVDSVKDGFIDMAYSIARDTGNKLSATEVSEALDDLIIQVGIDDLDVLGDYASTISDASLVLGANFSSLEDVLWADHKAGGKGKIMKRTLGTLTALNKEGLNLNYDSLLDAINSFAGTIYGAAKGNADTIAQANESYMAVMAASMDSASNNLVSDAVTQYAAMSKSSLYQNEELALLLANSNQSIDSFIRAQESLDYVKMAEMLSKSYQSLYYSDTSGVLAETAGVEWAQLTEFVFSDYDASLKESTRLISEMTEAEKEAYLSDIGAGETEVGIQTEIENALANSKVGQAITSAFGEWDFSLADAAYAVTIAQGVWDMGKGLSNFFKSGTGSKLFSSITSAGTVGSKITAGFSSVKGWLSGLGSKIFGSTAAKTAASTVGSAAVSGGSTLLTSLTGAGGLFEGATATSWGTGAGSAVFSKVVPALGTLVAVTDGLSAAEKSVEWLGEVEGNTTAGQFGAAVGGALGGEGSGWGNALKGAGKGAAIGSFFGPVGTAIGGAVGGILGYVGGEKIAQFASDTFAVVGDLGDAAVGTATDVLDKLGPVGNLAGDVLENTWDTVKDTAGNIGDVWSDSNLSVIEKIGGTGVELLKGAGNIVGGAIESVVDFGKNAWNGIKETASKVWSGIKETASSIWGGIKETASDVWNGLLDGASRLAEAGSVLLSGAGDFAAGLGEGIGSVASGFGDGIGSIASGLGSGGGDLLTGLGNFASSLLYGSTSGETVDMTAVSAGLTGDPILDRFDYALEYLRVIASNSGASDGSGGIVGTGLGIVSDIWDGAKAVGSWLWDGVTGLFGGSDEEQVVAETRDTTWHYDMIQSENNMLSRIQTAAIAMEGFALGFWDDFAIYEKNSSNKMMNRISTAAGGSIGADPSTTTTTSWFASMLGKLFGFEVGLDYVPYDNFPALLHKGETILTAETAESFRSLVYDLNSPTGVHSFDSDRISKNTSNLNGIVYNYYTDSDSDDDSEVVDTLKWAVTRLEKKLDDVINSNKQNNSRKVSPANALNASNSVAVFGY